MPMQNPPSPSVDWVNRLRPRVQQAQQEFQSGVSAGGNFPSLMNQYNDKIRAIRSDFIAGRVPEYSAAREVQQQSPFAAEVDSVLPTQARRTANEYRTYAAPARMNFLDVHMNEITRYGDARSSAAVSGDDKSVTVHLHARSLIGPGAGRSRVEAAPSVHWEFDSPIGIATEEWINDIAPALGV